MNDISHAEESGTSLGGYMEQLSSLPRKLRRYYRLLVLLLAAAFALSFMQLGVLPVKYTSIATVGPSSGTLSDEADSLSGGLGGGLVGGLAKHLGGGLGHLASGLAGGGSDTFDQYTELLTSNRLAAKLAQDQNVLRSMFYGRYDWDRHQWKQRDGVTGAIVNFAKGLLHYPIKAQPDQDDVTHFLASNVDVDAPLTTTFVTVSLIAKDPKEADWLLNTLLLDADSIIREDKRRDVAARIVYLKAALPQVTQADERDTLTSLLTDQEQSMMTIAADNRFSSTLVDTPHADLKPTSPSIPAVFAVTVLLALGGWGWLVYFLPENHWLLVRFSRPRRWRSWGTRSHTYAEEQN
jgi:hypothetical protein